MFRIIDFALIVAGWLHRGGVGSLGCSGDGVGSLGEVGGVGFLIGEAVDVGGGEGSLTGEAEDDVGGGVGSLTGEVGDGALVFLHGLCGTLPSCC
ncbi:hypothetical protein BVRB_5g105700 [Beta vulgaris subsp. vulgaris]|uniref:Secreted protein n=1 Tax=Beta vulgaris subsp. vulgaris TaxID=3555 RepID=A0A0J8CD63_BETVV|nr:hypothetical protein BVRB_5g105700 [Beta vulgaris subsp. vulgaris]